MNFIEVQFKGNRRVAYTNPMAFPVKLGDYVIVEAEKGEDLGRVVQISDEDRISQEEEREFVSPILRKAGPHDFQRSRRNQQREDHAEEVCRELVERHHLPMKVINVEYQLDGKKVTFFFTSEGRVDFRNLVKDLAGELRTRIDLRQIGARDEAKKFGGFGPCGQQQCCSGWLSRFDPVTTSMAKEQNLPLNPTKLSGNCGRLKCCLRYELDFYRTETKRYPGTDKPIETLRGAAFIDKVDIFGEEVLIRFRDGDLETISLEELNRLMDFDPEENHCKHDCGNGDPAVGKGDDSVLVASAKAPAGEEDAGDTGDTADSDQDGESRNRRRGRRGGRRNRNREGEGE
jgi:cell fate regulator YaaT (PSP1 superfamily)